MRLGPVGKLSLQAECFWGDCVIPLAMEVMASDIDGGEFGVVDGDAGVVGIGIELGVNREAGFGGGRGNQLDDDLVADQRLAAPVLSDERKETVLYFVPLAGAGRQMTYGNSKAELIGKPLQFELPQAQARSVAAAAIRSDQETLGIAIACLPPWSATSGGWH